MRILLDFWSIYTILIDSVIEQFHNLRVWNFKKKEHPMVIAISCWALLGLIIITEHDYRDK